MAAVTVIVPTFDHADTLYESVGSVCRQTFRDLEIVLVVDGGLKAAVDIAKDLCAADPRVRYEAFPKSPRTGEPHRDGVIRACSSEYIFYQSDDDLWLPHHVETLVQALQHADFVHSIHVASDVDGTLTALLGTLRSPEMRAMLRHRRSNLFGLPFAAHSRAAYLSLSKGWETTPEGCWTDLWMWSRWMELAPDRLATVLTPTALHFPSPRRGRWPVSRRVAELARRARELEHIDVTDLMSRIHFQLGPMFESLRNSRPRSLTEMLEAGGIVTTPKLSAAVRACESRDSEISLTAEQIQELELQFEVNAGRRPSSDTVGAWETLLRSRPDSSFRVARLCSARLAAGRAQDAVAAVEGLLGPEEVEPGTRPVDLLTSYAHALHAIGRVADAEQLIRRELDLSPKNFAMSATLAALNAKEGRADDAIAVLRRAAQSDSRVKRAPLEGLAGLLAGYGRFGEAEPVIREWLSVNPDHPRAWFLLARCCEARGDWDGCLKALTEVERLSPIRIPGHEECKERALANASSWARHG